MNEFERYKQDDRNAQRVADYLNPMVEAKRLASAVVTGAHGPGLFERMDEEARTFLDKAVPALTHRTFVGDDKELFEEMRQGLPKLDTPERARWLVRACNLAERYARQTGFSGVTTSADVKRIAVDTPEEV